MANIFIDVKGQGLYLINESGRVYLSMAEVVDVFNNLAVRS